MSQKWDQTISISPRWWAAHYPNMLSNLGTQHCASSVWSIFCRLWLHLTMLAQDGGGRRRVICLCWLLAGYLEHTDTVKGGLLYVFSNHISNQMFIVAALEERSSKIVWCKCFNLCGECFTMSGCVWMYESSVLGFVKSFDRQVRSILTLKSL